MATNTEVTTKRLRGLLDAVASMSADLSSDGLLERIIRLASELTDVRYGYLEVIDRQANAHFQPATYGIDQAGLRAKGPLPGGRELLIRLIGGGSDNLLRSDAARYLALPIRIQDEDFGTIYLTEKLDGTDFNQDDEDVAMAVATAAGVVIQNARLHLQSERQRLWLEAAAEVSAALLAPGSDAGAHQLIVDRAREVSGADFVALVVPSEDGAQIVHVISGMPIGAAEGEDLSVEGTVVGEVVRTGRAEVVADLTSGARHEPIQTKWWRELGSVLVLPLRSGDSSDTLLIGWLKGNLPDRWELDPVLPQRFADQAALALRVVQAREGQDSLAVFKDRDRIARDLHDLVIQRLFAIGLMLENTTKRAGSREVSERLSSAIDEIDETIKELRRAIFSLGSSPGRRDVRAQLESAISNSAELLGFRPRLNVDGPIESMVSDEVRENLIAVTVEALSNIVRHSKATEVAVAVDARDGITLHVRDNGGGLKSKKSGTGMRNMRRRAKMLGGSCDVRSKPGRGVEIIWSVPEVHV